MAKGKSLAYYEIHNIPNEAEFLIIYNHIIDGMYILEKVFKKNYKIRKFDISEMWFLKFNNGIAIFDSTKAARKISTFLESDLNSIFKYAYDSWQNKRLPYADIDRIHFWSKKNEFSLGKNDVGKWIWFQYSLPCYSYNPMDNF